MEVYGVVYVITCLLNGMKYVGQTTRSVERRFKEHFYEKTYIGSAMRKYGMENFKIEVIETCETREQLNEREKFWIAELKCMSPSGYNLTEGGEGITNCTDEIRAKMSAAKTGEKHHSFGKHFSPEHCAKISVAHKGKKHSREHRARFSATHRSKSPFVNLSNEITNHSLTYKELDKIMGLYVNAISQRMSGKKNFTESDIAKLVEIFGKPADYLMKRDDGKIFSPPNTNKTSFKNLLNEIEQRQLSYKTLAKLLGLSRASVSYKMLGKVKFSERDIAKLVEIFGKPADYLMARDE